jgi:transposase-like protein
LLHQIRACFDESEDYPLKGIVEVDETLVGTLPKGTRPGRGAAGRQFVIGAVEVRTGRLGDARMAVVQDVKSRSLVPFVQRNVRKDATICTDGWPAYNQLERDGYRRERHVAKGPKGGRFRPVIPGISLLFGNLKTWLKGRFHGVSDKYLATYVAEFTYRFNRRREPPELFGWVARRLMERPPRTLAAIRWAGESSG